MRNLNNFTVRRITQMSFNTFKNMSIQAMIALLVIVALVAIPITTTGQVRTSNQTPPNPVTTMTQTTLAAALSGQISGSAVNIMSVSSATGFTVGNRVVILSGGAVEAADILAVNSTNITLNRGVAGTSRFPHLSGDVVFTGRQALFASDSTGSLLGTPKVPCVSTTTGTGATAVVTSTTTPTPVISLPSGNVFYCAGGSSGQWVQTSRNGFSVGDAGATHVFAYTVAGAIAPVCGIHNIGTGGALAMTIAPPTKDLDGCVLIINATTAQAHTLTYTAGFSQNTTSSDVATFGGAINDGLVIYADAGVWRVISTRNVTIA
jgi:hypothetical protein